MGKFDGLIIVSDMDGTLLSSVDKIPETNVKAIEYFIKNGGRFTVATGRSHMSVNHFIDMVSINCPGIVDNGAILFDFEKQQVVMSEICSDSQKEVTAALQSMYPSIACYIFTEKEMFTPAICEFNDIVERIECVKSAVMPLDKIDNHWVKSVFYARPEMIEKIKEYANAHNTGDFETIVSDPKIFEILPKNINKGTALRRLSVVTGVPVRNIIAIGDYYNDYEMLKAAGFAAVPANAPADIKEIADIVVCDHKQGAIAQLVEEIEKNL